MKLHLNLLVDIVKVPGRGLRQARTSNGARCSSKNFTPLTHALFVSWSLTFSHNFLARPSISDMHSISEPVLPNQNTWTIGLKLCFTAMAISVLKISRIPSSSLSRSISTGSRWIYSWIFYLQTQVGRRWLQALLAAATSLLWNLSFGCSFLNWYLIRLDARWQASTLY